MLNVDDLTFGYTSDDVFSNIRFKAKPGEITAVLGANGAGKTTLLKCISGLERAEGRVFICGCDREKMSRYQVAESLSFLSQCTDCEAELNVFEVILLGRIQKLSFKVSAEDKRRVEDIMALLSISQFAHRKINELSGGQRQLVFIAQTLIKDPKVLILDEPTSALDLNKQFKLMNLIQKITRERQLTTLVTLHHLDIAARYADKVVVLSDKGVYAEGRPEDVICKAMLSDVYKINSEIYTDAQGKRHIVAVGPADMEIAL